MTEREEIIVDLSRFKLTARKSDSKLNEQSFSAITQKGVISMGENGENMPQGPNQDNAPEQQAGASVPTQPSSSEEQLLKSLDEIYYSDDGDVNRIVRERAQSGTTQDEVEGRKAADAVISLEDSEKVRQREQAKAQIISDVNTADIGKIRSVVSSGEMLDIFVQNNPTANKELIQKKLEELSTVDDETSYREKLGNLLSRAIDGDALDDNDSEPVVDQSAGAGAAEKEISLETGSPTETGGAPEDENDPVVLLKLQLMGPMGVAIRNKAADVNEAVRFEQKINKLIGLYGDEFMVGNAQLMAEVFGGQNPEIPEPSQAEVEAGEQEVRVGTIFNSFDERDQVLAIVLQNLEDMDELEVEQMLKKDGEAIVRTFSDGTGHEDDYAALLEKLIEKSSNIKSDFKGLLDEIRADAAAADSLAESGYEEEDDEVVAAAIDGGADGGGSDGSGTTIDGGEVLKMTMKIGMKTPRSTKKWKSNGGHFESGSLKTQIKETQQQKRERIFSRRTIRNLFSPVARRLLSLETKLQNREAMNGLKK